MKILYISTVPGPSAISCRLSALTHAQPRPRISVPLMPWGPVPFALFATFRSPSAHRDMQGMQGLARISKTRFRSAVSLADTPRNVARPNATFWRFLASSWTADGVGQPVRWSVSEQHETFSKNLVPTRRGQAPRNVAQVRRDVFTIGRTRFEIPHAARRTQHSDFGLCRCNQMQRSAAAIQEFHGQFASDAVQSNRMQHSKNEFTDKPTGDAEQSHRVQQATNEIRASPVSPARN